MAEYERLLIERNNARYELRLYVTGMTVRSFQAIENVKDICEAELPGRYHLEVIDIAKDPEAAKSAQVFAAPTLIKLAPLPFRRLIGDLSDKDRVIVGLELSERNGGNP